MLVTRCLRGSVGSAPAGSGKASGWCWRVLTARLLRPAEGALVPPALHGPLVPAPALGSLAARLDVGAFSSFSSP